ncbi:hypothetical protein GEV43_11470 [Actinomadura sp. J1-007]|nr:hypothetical protein [Actinomadura sp. J1-007]
MLAAPPPEKSAPRPRGWFSMRPAMRTRAVVGPAPAGMVPGRPDLHGHRRGRPRARGDGSRSRCPGEPGRASAPRPRGWFLEFVDGGRHVRVGPAPAGMVRGLRILNALSRLSAPRPRGWFCPGSPGALLSPVGPASGRGADEALVPSMSPSVEPPPRARG